MKFIIHKSWLRAQKHQKQLKFFLTDVQKYFICTKAACPSLWGPVANLVKARDSACMSFCCGAVLFVLVQQILLSSADVALQCRCYGGLATQCWCCKNTAVFMHWIFRWQRRFTLGTLWAIISTRFFFCNWKSHHYYKIPDQKSSKQYFYQILAEKDLDMLSVFSY